MITPVVALYAAHYRNSLQMPGWIATGFTQWDMPVYVANAREYLDRPEWRLGYSNPCSWNPHSPRIYFQPLTLLLAGLLGLTGGHPGVVFMLLGLAAGVVCWRVAIALYEELYGLRRPQARWALPCFLWGGGLFVIVDLVTGAGLSFRHDPSDGWWFLNLGRNLVYPTEAFYHILALGCVLLLIRRRWTLAILTLFLLSLSHPLTGAQFCLIVLGWTVLERYCFQNAAVPVGSVLGAVACLAFHVGYYLAFLPRFPEHASVMAQMQAPYLLHADALLLGYGLVALLVLWQIRRFNLARQVLASPTQRLLAVWLIVSFALANNEMFIKPIQPLHFTRGYIWTPLFLLGAPVLMRIFKSLRSLKFRPLYFGLSLVVVAVMVADNAAWFWVNCRQPTGVYLQADTLQMLNYLRRLPQPQNQIILFTNTSELAYLAQAYTGIRTWYSHYLNTPFAHERYREITNFFNGGKLPANLPRGSTILVEVGNANRNPATSRLAKVSKTMEQIGRYLIVRY